MAATALSSLTFTTPKCFNPTNIKQPTQMGFVSMGSIKLSFKQIRLGPVRSSPTPSDISDKLSDSIEKAKETCADDNAKGECAAAWDEVEELSATAKDARLKADKSDPLEEYCKDNPETDECRTYDD